MYKRILVALDGSDTSKRGLAEAVKLAKDSPDAAVRLVSVINTDLIALEYAAADTSSEDFLGDLGKTGSSALQEAEVICRQSGVRSESVLLRTSSGKTGDLIVKQANEWPADLIVLGTHGRGGLERLLLGSTAEFVLRHTPVPLLLIRKAS